MSDRRDAAATEPRQMWLTLVDGLQVGIDRKEAYSLDVKGFAKLYRQHVYGASRREAKRWAKAQVAEREAILWAAT